MKIWRKARGAKASFTTIMVRACFRKILQRDFLHRRSSRFKNINFQTASSYSIAAAHDTERSIFNPAQQNQSLLFITQLTAQDFSYGRFRQVSTKLNHLGLLVAG
jgi:hypothetical protein